MNRLSLWRLQCFAALAKELHFGRAASALFITQPALSLQIKRLEISLGCELVERARQVRLTDDGRRLLPYAEQVLAAADEFAVAASGGSRLRAA